MLEPAGTGHLTPSTVMYTCGRGNGWSGTGRLLEAARIEWRERHGRRLAGGDLGDQVAGRGG
jgi:hypothetical protein